MALGSLVSFRKVLATASVALSGMLAWGTTYYVAPSGVDEAGRGGVDAPFATIAYALGVSSAEDEIVLAKSATPYYADDLSVAKNVTIRSVTGIPEDVIVAPTPGQKKRVFSLNSAKAILRGLTISDGNCDEKKGGGNIYIDANGGIVENCIVRNGFIDAQQCKGGAGIYIDSTSGRVSNSIITNNIAGALANNGAVALAAAGLVENCFIAYNKSANNQIGVNMKGAGVYAGVSGAKVLNCTIYANEAVGSAAVYLGHPSALFQNCLIWGNKGCGGALGTGDIVGGNFNSSTFRNCAARTTAIKDNQSHFIALTSLPAIGALLKPVAGSPLIGAGAVHGSAVSKTDLAGNPRTVGDKIDIGCFQYQGAAPSIGMTISKRVFRVSENLAVSFTATLDNATASEYVWNFGDDTTETTTAPTVTHTYTTAGKFSPSVTAAGLTYTATDEIHALPDTMYVVQNNAGEQYPYDTKATAAKLPETAIAAAEADGIEVVIADGTYTSTTTPILKHGITVRGESGVRENVVIVGNKNSGCVRGPYLDHRDAKLLSVTLKQGWETSNWGNESEGVGLTIAGGGGVVSNCLITCVYPSGLIYSAVYIAGANGLVTHSKATACTTGETGTIGIFKLTNGRLENCWITGNTRIDNKYADKGAAVIVNGTDAIVRNCTIVNNTMSWCGGVIAYKGVVRNCVLADNTVFNPQSGKGVSKNYWVGQEAQFDHCATDDAAAINDTCKIGSSATFFKTGELVPVAGGPLYNTGVNPDPCEPTDYAGFKRISGGTIDIGAWEADADTLRFEIIPNVTEALVPATIRYTVGLSGTNGTDVFRCYWTFDGGATYHERENEITWSYSTPASNDVGVIVSNLTTQTGYGTTKTGVVATLPRTMYVAAENPTSAWPYDTWEHAATSLDTAVATMLDGGEIVISNGFHKTTSLGLSIDRQVTVRGATGRPEDVTLQAMHTAYQNCYYAYTLNNAKAVLRDLTIAGKKNNLACSLQIATPGGTVTNCVITGGNARDHWVLGGAVYMNSENALVTHCVITNNTVTYAGTRKGIVFDEKGGRLSNCLVAYNQIRITDPKTVTNSSYWISAVTSVGRVDNCTIVSNDSYLTHMPLNMFTDKKVGETALSGEAVNTLVAYNTGLTNTVPVTGTSGAMRRCLTDAEATLAGLFVDPSAGNWRLTEAGFGTAINKGLRRYEAAYPSVDLDGRARKVSISVDIGCYEYELVRGTLLFLR